MPLQTLLSGVSPADAYNMIRGNAAGVKAQAQNALISLGGSVSTPFVFQVVDQLNSIAVALGQWKIVSGLDSYAAAQGYNGSLLADATACQSAATACVNWVTTNFPIGTAYTAWNADGSRVPHVFTTAQTAGLQTLLSAFIATIG